MFLFILLLGTFLLSTVCAHNLVTISLAPRRAGYEPPSPRFGRYVALVFLAAACSVPLLADTTRWWGLGALLIAGLLGALSHFVVQLDYALDIAHSLKLVGLSYVDRIQSIGTIVSWAWLVTVVVVPVYAGWAAVAVG